MVSHASDNQSFSLQHTTSLSNGAAIPTLGLGTWRSEPGVVRQIVKTALLAGYRHLDCAYCYGNHKEVGQGIQDAIAESNGSIKREDLWITSKLWNSHHAPNRAHQQIQQILDDLQLQYLDLFLIHWSVSWHPPADGGYFPSNPDHDHSHTMEDTWRAMEEMVSKGQTRSIGVSNFSISETQAILDIAKVKPVMNQAESHPYFNNHELLDWCLQHQIRFTAYSPLGNLSLPMAGKLEDSSLRHPVITAIAEKHSKSTAQVILRWHLQSGAVVIPKSSNEGRVKENADLYGFELSADEMQQINGLDKGQGKGRLINPKTRPGGKPIFPQ